MLNKFNLQMIHSYIFFFGSFIDLEVAPVGCVPGLLVVEVWDFISVFLTGSGFLAIIISLFGLFTFKNLKYNPPDDKI